jgi:hypothetical protein
MMKRGDRSAHMGANPKAGNDLATQSLHWMTPSVSNAQGNEYTRDRGQEGSERLTLTGQANQWATPTQSDTTGPSLTAGQQGTPNLRTQADAWPTPRSTDGTKGGPNQAGSKGDLMLPSMAAQWPTPRATEAMQQNSRDNGMALSAATAQWPTPASRDHKGHDLPSRNGGASLSHAAETGVFSHSSRLDRPTLNGPASSQLPPTSPQRLNPLFGEWLMGWPSQWTKAEPSASSASATALWRRRLASHLSCLLDEQGGAL